METKEDCDDCKGLDGDICYPQYGVAPHKCFYQIEGASVGGSELLPKEEWPENFIEDPDSPGCGMWFCPTCKSGMEEYKRLFTPAANFNPVGTYNLVKAGIDVELTNPKRVNKTWEEQERDMNKKPGFWGNRKPIYQQISQAKYERIVHGRGHRAIVETNAYFRVTRGINRLNGTAISCYVLFNRAYWFNPVDSKHYSIQLNGYIKGTVNNFSISSAYYASHRKSRDWEMIELEWLIEDCKVQYVDLDLYSFPFMTADKVFERKMGPEAKQPLYLQAIRALFDEQGTLKPNNENLLI